MQKRLPKQSSDGREFKRKQLVMMTHGKVCRKMEALSNDLVALFSYDSRWWLSSLWRGFLFSAALSDEGPNQLCKQRLIPAVCRPKFFILIHHPCCWTYIYAKALLYLTCGWITFNLFLSTWNDKSALQTEFKMATVLITCGNFIL